MIYPWQQKQWQRLQLQLQNGTLPHALLLNGPQGMGKLDFAKAWAGYLLCNNRQQVACGTCRSCQLFAAQTHPDLLELMPAGEGRIIKIEQVRELLAELGQTAQQGAVQVVIIHPAEAMNIAAANALLKNLEEPPGNILFLLISHQPAAISATIRSRCQRLSFTPPDPALSLSWLQDCRILPDAAALPSNQVDLQQLLKMAENIPLRALDFAQKGWDAVYNKIQQQLQQLSQGTADPLILATNFLEEEFTRVYPIIWSVLMEMVHIKLQQSHQLPALSKLFGLLDKLTDIKKMLEKKINLNMQLIYETFFIEWSQAFSDTT